MTPLVALLIAVAGVLGYLFTQTQSAGVVWLGLLLAIAFYEGVAITRHGQTLSQWVWAQDRRFPWFRYVVLSLTGLLMWHFFGKR